MGWWRQCCALMRKNRIIKCRLWGSTLAELLLPVLIMVIMVGLRAAVEKEDKQSDLRYAAPTPASAEAQAAARARDIPVLNGVVFNNEVGPMPWDPQSIAQFWFDKADRRRGLRGVRHIHFVPNNPSVRNTVNTMANAFKVAFPVLKDLVQTKFNSDSELEDYVKGPDYALSPENAAIGIALVLESEAPHWRYTLRGNASASATGSTTLNTNEPVVNTLQVEFDENNWPNLYLFGHHLLQDFAERWILQQQTGASFERNYFVQPFPTPPYIEDVFADTISAVLGLFFTIIFMWPVTRLLKGIVEEKQLRIREGMKMMGMPDSAIFCSWFGTYFLIFLVTAILITLVTSATVYEHSNKFYIFIFFFFFSLTTFSFCWLISVFFSRSQVATTFGALLFLVSYFPYFAVQGNSSNGGAKGGACLLAPVCFGLGAVVIQKLESRSGGINADTASTEVDGWSYNGTIGMFIADFFIYLLLALYFQQIVPSEWGTSQRWWFCVKPSFWCPKKVSVDGEGAPLRENAEAGGAERNHSSYFEPVSDAVKAELGVSIQNLRKVFPPADGKDEFVAVKGLNLDLYAGQILSLLGHNGAGKTTTINMLSGMLAPSGGDAYVYGTSIRNNIGGVRKILGVCPQHNILFDLLTVKEHLELYCAVKGVPSDQTDALVLEMIEQVGLTEKVNDKSAALSGGMQRKLSVAIALIGDSKIVFLDEPTSGMDPYSRRATWDLLKKKKEGRVIILTTHFMDEADQLGDRIAIMANGDVKCCGSSLFLKGRYGVGYTLTITKGDGFVKEKLVDLIRSVIPDATQLSDIAAEISFRLPFQSSGNFADLFDQFDRDAAGLGVGNYSISVTTLEEVFLRVGHEDDATPEAIEEHKRLLAEAQRKLSDSQHEPRQPPQDVFDAPDQSPELVIDGASQQSPHASFSGSNKLAAAAAASSSPNGGGMQTISVKASPRSGSQQKQLTRRHSSRFAKLRIPGEEVNMFPTHFRALFIKRLLNAKRDRKVWTWTLVYPFLILFIGIGLLNIRDDSFKKFEISGANLKQDSGVNPVPVWRSAGNPLFDPASAPPGTNFIDLATQSAAWTSQEDFSKYLLDTLHPTPTLAESRYVAFHSDFRATGPNAYADNSTIFFNTTSMFSSTLGLNMYNNAVLRHLSPGSSISLSIHPFPQTLNMQTLMNSVTAIIVAIGFAFIPANFISYAVKEEQDKVKHQQLISGVSASAYWGANYVWDFLNYMVMGLLCLLIFRIWGISELIGANTGATFLAIVLYGLSVIPFNYCLSFLFTDHNSAQNSSLLFYIFAGALLLIAMIVLQILPSTRDVAAHIVFICRLFPPFCFGESIANIITRESSTAFGAPKPLWDLKIVGYPFIFMAWEIVAYAAFVLIREKVYATPSIMAKLFGNPRVDAPNVEEEDPDVIAERTRLQSGQGGKDIIQIQGLRKVYKGRLGGGNKIAVQNLWFGIPEGQCFGYLGINGAGKTTTLKMLTGDILPTEGTATLSGHDILTHQNDVRRLLGYCPQFDCLIDTLTAREHLMLFARIKGVPEEVIPEYCEHLILKLGLQEGIADKPSKGYSGGNKRKLCVGMALIGNPPIVFLDEPSTGMDPGSRRFMWDLIASTMKSRSVILTTHSMEECEALCHRIGIMVGGRLRCLGSPSHLKSVYGSGFQLDVNVAEENLDSLKQGLESNWGEVHVIEEHGNNIKFRLPKEINGVRTTIGSIFRFMEENKERLAIKDYALAPTTLEQIFIGFAKQQEEEKGPVAGIR